MLDTIHDGLQPMASPPLVPESEAIDLPHLFRMTLGDRALQREILQLFDRQAGLLLARIREGAPETAAALAHILKGSARGVGAWQVATAAEALEAACAGGAELAPAVAALDAAVTLARAAIADHL